MNAQHVVSNEPHHRERLRRIGHRPVIGEDLKRIQITYDLSSLDASYLMGCHASRYCGLTGNKYANERITPVTRCLLIRLIHDWSAWGRTFPVDQSLFRSPLMIPSDPSAKHFYRVVRSYMPVIQQRWPAFTEAHMGILLGLSGYRTIERWTLRGDTPNPVSQNLMTMLIADDIARDEEAMVEHLERVEQEATARGHANIDDVLHNSRWNSVKTVKRKKRKNDEVDEEDE